MTRHLDVTQLAQRWHTSEKAIYGQRHRGELPPAFRVGRRLLWPEEAIEAFERSRTEGSATTTSSTTKRPAKPVPVRDYSGWFKGEGRPA